MKKPLKCALFWLTFALAAIHSPLLPAATEHVVVMVWDGMRPDYAEDNGDEFPRSQHSAFTHGQLTWGHALAPQLGSGTTTWTNLLRTVYHCPGDHRTNGWSYGLNVYYELGPDDDYKGKPQTWRRAGTVPRPSATILFAENASGADHIMPNFWTASQDAVDVASRRHGRKANYNFVDGHAEARDFPSIYEPAHQLDQWNPARAQ